MKNLILISLVFLSSFTAHSQSVAINTDASAPNTSAILDIKSITKGLLIPRMTTVQRTAIATPATGLLIYQTDNTSGYYYYNGTGWLPLAGSGAATNYWTSNGNDIFSNVAGNVGMGSSTPLAKLSVQTATGNYGIIHTDGTITVGSYIGNSKGWLGTKSNHPLTFFTNNSNEQMTLLANGNFGIGTIIPGAKLHLAGNMKIDGNNTLEFGAGIAGKEVSAGKIGYQSFGANNALDIVGAGTGANRKIKFWNEGGAEFAGSVAVGLSDPSFNYKMDIADRIRIRSGSASSTAGIALNNSNNSVVSAFIGTKDVDLVGMYGSASGWGLLMNTNTGAIGIGYQSPVAGYRLSVLGNQFINGLLVTTGNVEMQGNATIDGSLDVTGYRPKYFGHFYYFDGLIGTTESQIATTDFCSIVANYTISGDRFLAFSDGRIKNIIGTSQSTKDLEIINALQIRDYTMKDKERYGKKLFKKVIAQEVEKVYPEVVSRHPGYIPNVYQITDKIEKTGNGYNLHFANKHTITAAAKKIRVQLKDGDATKDFDIVSIPSDNTVEIKVNDLKADKIFVYGEQVEDFRSVDYEGLSTLNISATQELSKLLTTQQAAIDAQGKKIELLIKEIELLKGKNSITLEINTN